jgi:hypothetical protein
MEPCRCRLDLPLLGLAPSSKGCGSNLWLLANIIVIFHWTMDLRPSSKVTLNTPNVIKLSQCGIAFGVMLLYCKVCQRS